MNQNKWKWMNEWMNSLVTLKSATYAKKKCALQIYAGFKMADSVEEITSIRI
jgi:hypothetical protein